jgi:hypothetical protein
MSRLQGLMEDSFSGCYMHFSHNITCFPAHNMGKKTENSVVFPMFGYLDPFTFAVYHHHLFGIWYDGVFSNGPVCQGGK